VKEQIDHIREGRHGARSTKQAIAIGLSKARRAGVQIPSGPNGEKAASPRSASHAKVSRTRSRAHEQALQKEGSSGASKSALARQARASAARKAARTRSRG